MIVLIALVTPSRAQDECPALDSEIVLTPAAPQASFWTHYKNITYTSATVALLGDSHAFYWRQSEWNTAFPNVSMVNLGIPGDRVQNTLWRLQRPEMQQISPQFVVLFIGTNNFSDRTAPCAIALGSARLIEEVDRLWPDATIFVVRPFLSGAFGGRNAKETAAYWDMLADDTDLTTDAILIDLSTAGTCRPEDFYRWYRMIDAPPPGSPCAVITRDLGHLTPAGYGALGRAFTNVLASLNISFSGQ